MRDRLILCRLKISPVAFTVLLMPTENVSAKRENKNLKVVERVCAGQLCVEFEWASNDAQPPLFIAPDTFKVELKTYPD